MNNIRMTIEEADSKVFKVIDSVVKADKIYILGLRSAAPLAQFMGYYLNFILDNVRITSELMIS